MTYCLFFKIFFTRFFLRINYYDKIFIASKNNFRTTNPAYGRHWISQPMRIEVGDVRTGAPTYKNFQENRFELVYVDFEQVTAILVLPKIIKNGNHQNEIIY